MGSLHRCSAAADSLSNCGQLSMWSLPLPRIVWSAQSQIFRLEPRAQKASSLHMHIEKGSYTDLRELSAVSSAISAVPLIIAFPVPGFSSNAEIDSF